MSIIAAITMYVICNAVWWGGIFLAMWLGKRIKACLQIWLSDRKARHAR